MPVVGVESPFISKEGVKAAHLGGANTQCRHSGAAVQGWHSDASGLLACSAYWGDAERQVAGMEGTKTGSSEAPRR